LGKAPEQRFNLLMKFACLQQFATQFPAMQIAKCWTCHCWPNMFHMATWPKYSRAEGSAMFAL